MANRFNNILPSSRRYVNQYWTPNANLLAKALQEQQNSYNVAQEAGNIPISSLPVDEPYAQQLRQGIEDKIDNLANIYKNQGVTAGNRERMKFMRDIRRMQLPGGEVARLKNNLDKYNLYKEQIDKFYTDGKINKDKRDRLLSNSLSDFKGSFIDGVYNEFSGITAAEDVNLAEQAAKLADNWMADQIQSGRFRQTANGQYFDISTKKFVDKQEVYDNVSAQLLNNPTNKAFLRQEAQLKGLTGEDGINYMASLVDSAAKFAADKEGYEQFDSKYLKNWAAEEELKQKNRYKLADYEYNMGGGEANTRFFTVNSGMAPLDFKDGKIFMGEKEGRYLPRQGVTVGKERIYEDVPIEEFIKTKKGAEQYPGLEKIIDRFPRKKEGNNVESNKDYNERISKIWNFKRDRLSSASGTYTQYNGKKKSQRKETVIGTGASIGDIMHKTIWLTKPGQPPKPFSFENFMDFVDAKDSEEFIKRSNVLGEVRADSPLVPSGEEGSYIGKDNKPYSFIIENISNQDAMIKTPIYGLTAPLRDGTMENSGEFIINGEVVSTQAYDNFTVDDGGNPIDYNRTLHVIGADGTDLTEEDGITPEQLLLLNQRSNQFSPLNQSATNAEKSGNTIITNKNE